MGLAASQARLLSLTARLSNSEFEIQSNLNQKASLSASSDGLTRNYENSLNLKKMTMQVFDQFGSTQVDLSYKALTNYKKDSLDNPPYIVVDAKGRVAITADILNAFQIYNQFQQANPDLDALKRAWDNSIIRRESAEQNITVVAKRGDDYVTSETARAEIEVIKIEENNKKAMLGAKAQYEADKAEIKRLKEARDDAAANMDITDFISGDLTAYNKARAELITGGHAGPVASEAAKAGKTPEDYLDEIRNEYLRLLIQTNGKNGNSAGNADYSNPSGGDATNPAFALYKDAMNKWGCSCNEGGNYFLQTYNLFLENRDEVLKGEKEWQDALQKAYGDDKLNFADYTEPYNKDIGTDGKAYDADSEGNRVGNGIGGSEEAYIKAYDKWLNSAAEGEILRNQIITAAENKRNADNQTAQNTLNNAIQEETNARIAYENALANMKKPSDAEQALMDKYDPLLYEKMNKDGYTLEYSNDLDKTKWFQENLRAGRLFIQRYDKQSFEGKGGYVDDSWQTGTVPSSEVADYEGRAEIKTKYDRDMEKLQKLDKNFDMNIKRLETEHQAIETEYEAVKKVIDKNVESSFKTFG